MKVLFACKEFPHAKVIGGPIIIFNRLKYLSQRHDVSLAAFIVKEEDRQYIPTVEPFCMDLRLIPVPRKRPLAKAIHDFFFSNVPHYFLVNSSPEMHDTIAEMVARDHYDFVITEYSVMGQYIYGNPKLPPVRRIMSVHECYSLARAKAFRHDRVSLNGAKELINLKGLKRYEFAMYRSANKVLTLTPEGRDELLEIEPSLDVAVVPHGVDVEHFAFTGEAETELSVVFVGNYPHYPNVDAVLYFHHEIWPKIRKAYPDIKFYVVGQAPPPEISALSREGDIIVTGRVDDVHPYLEKSRVFVCPVRLGGGFRGKILEAMSTGRPVVSTPLGAQGVPVSNGENIMIADEPGRFSDAVIELLRDETLYQRMARNARALVEDKFAWVKGVEVLEGTLEEMMKNKPES
jgi:glycosyltransferase involved in cell wall biosynthesis